MTPPPFLSGTPPSLQVLVWKTNFDKADYKDTLHSHGRTLVPSRPHTHDPPNVGMVVTTHTHQNKPRPLELDPTRTPTDRMTPVPHVVNVGPQMFHKPTPQFIEPTPLINGGVDKSETTPLEVMTMSPQLTNTLEHIVGQLDILTQVHVHAVKVLATWKCTVQV